MRSVTPAPAPATSHSTCTPSHSVHKPGVPQHTATTPTALTHVATTPAALMAATPAVIMHVATTPATLTPAVGTPSLVPLCAHKGCVSRAGQQRATCAPTCTQRAEEPHMNCYVSTWFCCDLDVSFTLTCRRLACQWLVVITCTITHS